MNRNLDNHPFLKLVPNQLADGISDHGVGSSPMAAPDFSKINSAQQDVNFHFSQMVLNLNLLDTPNAELESKLDECFCAFAAADLGIRKLESIIEKNNAVGIARPKTAPAQMQWVNDVLTDLVFVLFENRECEKATLLLSAAAAVSRMKT